jgi:NTP pyrophosphatase (non-canonical NTP hydrolase)
VPDLKQWQRVVHQGAKDRGWYDGELGEKTELRIASLLCLVHSEVSEALEDLREGKMLTTQTKRQGFKYKPKGFPSELADILIRVLDMAEWLGIDLEEEVRLKNDYNETRGYKHGGKAL